jgi:sulfide:quinone oxidoreductase
VTDPRLADDIVDGRLMWTISMSMERLSMYLLKAYALPRLYWDGMLRGRA